jgi:general stress protein YciG
MTVGKGKRPRDPNQLAKWIVDRSTGQIPEESSKPAHEPGSISEYMATIGRKGGQIGGKTAAQDHDQGTTSESCCKGG